MEYIFSDKIAGLKPSAIREIFKSLTDPSIISFAAGNPSPLSFPVEELSELSADIFKKDASTALQYGITEGYTPLRDAIARRQAEKFGTLSEGDSVMVVSGGQQGIELCCKIFCNEGDAVLCEDPSFIGSLNSFRSNGARTVGVPMEEDGLSIEALEQVLKTEKRAKLLYLIPTFQNPTGITMSLEKRKAVLALAKQYGIVILEDNPYGELRFAGEDLPTLKALDSDGLVVYCSSFSKILSSGMRLGFVIAPAPILQKMAVAKQGEDVHSNLFFQMLAHRYMTECDLEGHIAEIRALYRRKSALMLSCIEQEIPPELATFTRPMGGLFLWGTLPHTADSTPLVQKALEKQVAVVPGSAFSCTEGAPSPSFRLNYSMPSDEQIVLGIRRLGQALREL